jgi:hypothetical protein
VNNPLNRNVIPDFVKIVERGQHLEPTNMSGRTGFDVLPADWDHVASCRFGEARGVKYQGDGGWSGDCYRYDIFRRLSGTKNQAQWAIRWTHGGGTGWLIGTPYTAMYDSLIQLIAIQPNEASRWDYCHAICEGIDKTARETASEVKAHIAGAFINGRLKKRRKNGEITVEITPVAPNVLSEIVAVLPAK